MSARGPRVLFACVGNSGRSIMAEAFARKLGLDARSGGSRPLGHVLPTVVEAMREKDIDVSAYPSKGFDEEWIREKADLVVTMGCGDDACPAFIGKKMVDWELPDPKGKSLDEVRRIRDEIERRVRALTHARDVQAYFSDKAEAYRTSKTHANKADLDRMMSWIAARPGERALDVATGGGHTAMALAAAGCETIATDATLPMIRDHPPLPRAACDAERLPFRRASFDVVASRIAPHHFPDLALFAQECARVLRPGGRLYIFDLATPEDPTVARLIDHVERLRDPSHGHSWSANEWRDALAKAGLRIDRLESTSSTFDLEPWIERARMSPERERELRSTLAARPELGGYGLTPEGRMRVLRVEILARAG